MKRIMECSSHATLSQQQLPSGVDGLSLEIHNVVDVTPERNIELGMRLSSDVDNGDTFYTDLNGFQVCTICVFKPSL